MLATVLPDLRSMSPALGHSGQAQRNTESNRATGLDEKRLIPASLG